MRFELNDRRRCNVLVLGNRNVQLDAVGLSAYLPTMLRVFWLSNRLGHWALGRSSVLNDLLDGSSTCSIRSTTNLSSERSRLLYSARNRVNGAQVCLSTDNWIARSLYISSTVWACPIHSTSCRLKGPRLANGSGHNGQLFRSVQNLLAIIMKILLTISFAKF